jgi:Carbohydrate esterase, sialic acid-specific acetylesterase
MPSLMHSLKTRASSALSLMTFLALTGCSGTLPEGDADGPFSGGQTSTGGLNGGGTGGAAAGTGGAGTGGAGVGTGGGSLGSGGADQGSGGAGTGGIGSGTGGADTGTGVFHIFLLMGQSNMAGVAKFENSDKNTDVRLQVWGGGNQPPGQWNLANPPLHDAGEKGWNPSDAVGPGMWFAKTLLEELPAGDSIGLVGVAESGQSINTFISGGIYHQAIMNKIAAVKGVERARFEGIIFHQGESDNENPQWPDKVVQLYGEVKAAFGVDYDVPFILGELPTAGCCGGHNTQVHLAADKLPMGAWITQDGTNVLDQYHFDHASVVLMGKRYGDSMIEALGW